LQRVPDPCPRGVDGVEEELLDTHHLRQVAADENQGHLAGSLALAQEQGDIPSLRWEARQIDDDRRRGLLASWRMKAEPPASSYSSA
jgi:hypothetical protein